MLGSSKQLCSPEKPSTSSLVPTDRNEKKNHASKLQELALLLPAALKTGNKKLTKKEILLHVLQYIHHLQRSIDVARALLEFHTSDGEGGFKGLGRNLCAGPVRRRHATPSGSPGSQKSRIWGACQKPRKKKLTRASGQVAPAQQLSQETKEPAQTVRKQSLEHQTRAQKPRRSLALDKPEKLVTTSLDQEEENTGGTTIARCTDPCGHLQAVLSSSQGDDGEGGRSQLTLLDMAKDTVPSDMEGHCYVDGTQDDEPDPDLEAQRALERTYFLNKTQLYPRQELPVYDSSKEVDKEAPDADPWLPAWTPEDSPNGSPLALGPPQINTWSVTGHPSEILGLSPSLFSSPSKILPQQTLDDSTLYLTEGLFEEVLLGLESPPSAFVPEALQEQAHKDPPDSHAPCQSSVSLDHCYLPLSENSKALSSASSEDTDTESLSEKEEDMQANSEDTQSSSDENEDYTWTPTWQASAVPIAGRKGRKGQASVKPKEGKKAPCPAPVKKKCVNGFIMFCRMNRKQYIRACPGTASTAATKELANMWRAMTTEERRPYCTKARRFSRQHNRIVKQDSSSSEDGNWETPKPFYQLLAEKAQASPAPASPSTPHQP